MKSKILFALFTLVIFCSGVTAGAKEMQAFVETIDNGDYEKAKIWPVCSLKLE